MRVGGAQGVLGRAAEHGAVELGGDAVQDQLAAAVLQPPVKQGPAHPGPGEQRLREHLVLRTSGETSETREETSETREETSGGDQRPGRRPVRPGRRLVRRLVK